MPKAPPLLPEEVLQRVLRVARLDGLSVAFCAGTIALLCAGSGNAAGAIVGVLVAGCGAMELHGVTVLRRGEPRGFAWLLVSQCNLLVLLLGYCTWRLTHLDLEVQRAIFQEALKSDFFREMWRLNQEAGWTEASFLTLNYRLTYVTVMLATLLYQGGMLVYYKRRWAAVQQALDAGEPTE